MNIQGDNSKFILDFGNVTLCGKKVWNLFASMEQADRPHAFAMVEAHLRGRDLNQARRRFASLGWLSHCTPAVLKADKFLGTDAVPNQNYSLETGRGAAPAQDAGTNYVEDCSPLPANAQLHQLPAIRLMEEILHHPMTAQVPGKLTKLTPHPLFNVEQPPGWCRIPVSDDLFFC
jgi:hypothetical protein